MADIKPLWIDPNNINGITLKWETITEADTASPFSITDGYSDLSAVIYGTFGGATIALHGSLDGVNYFLMVDAYGNDMSYTAASSIRAVGPAVTHIKPTISGGTGTDVDVEVYIAKKKG